LTYIEVPLLSTETGIILKDIYGFSPSCWGVANANDHGENKALGKRKPATKTTSGTKPKTKTTTGTKPKTKTSTATKPKTTSSSTGGIMGHKATTATKPKTNPKTTSSSTGGIMEQKTKRPAATTGTGTAKSSTAFAKTNATSNPKKYGVPKQVISFSDGDSVASITQKYSQKAVSSAATKTTNSTTTWG
jgi:hypothetical protein